MEKNEERKTFLIPTLVFYLQNKTKMPHFNSFRIVEDTVKYDTTNLGKAHIGYLLISFLLHVHGSTLLVCYAFASAVMGSLILN